MHGGQGFIGAHHFASADSREKECLTSRLLFCRIECFQLLQLCALEQSGIGQAARCRRVH